MANKVVRSEVIETGFGFYTDEDVKNLSVCKVVSPVSTDALNNPLSRCVNVASIEAVFIYFVFTKWSL